MKISVFSLTPRILLFIVFCFAWILSAIFLLVLALTYFPKYDCLLNEIQKYDNIELVNTRNSNRLYCSYATVSFYWGSSYESRDVCLFCNSIDKDEKRDECLEYKFLDYYDIKEKDFLSKTFSCSKDYEGDFAILEEEFTELIVTQGVVIGILVIFLLIPFVLFIILCIILCIVLGNCSFVGDFLYGSLVLEKVFSRNKKKNYELKWDTNSRHISNRRILRKPFGENDPMFHVLKKTYFRDLKKKPRVDNGIPEGTELIRWIDDKSRFVTPLERKYFIATCLVILFSLSVMLVLLVERFIFYYVSIIVFDVLSPFLNVLLFWNIFIFLSYLIQKLTVKRLVTTRRICRICRIPFYGTFLMYINMEDIKNVEDNNGVFWVIFSVRGKEIKLPIFKTLYNPVNCLGVIRQSRALNEGAESYLDQGERNRNNNQRGRRGQRGGDVMNAFRPLPLDMLEDDNNGL